MDNLLAGGIPSMRSSVLACYGNFFHGLRNSDALELRTLACVAASDIRSTTGSNLKNLSSETSLDPRGNRWKVRETILNKKCPVPEIDRWRIPCLQKFLGSRYELEMRCEDTSEVDSLILSLVTS